MHKIFTYGTLMSGFGNNKRLLSTSKFVKPGVTLPEFTMVSCGGFPGVMSGGDTPIHGEVWEVDDDVLIQLDRLEGHPTWYVRTPITLQDGTQVEMYVYPQRGNTQPVVVSGDWRRYVAQVNGGPRS